MQAQGQCLCGKVKITTQNKSDKLGACHCSMCRKWSGGPYLGVNCGTDLQVEGNEFVTEFNSSDWAARAFCKQCGTHLYYKLKPKSVYVVPAGLFEEPVSLTFDHQIFIDSKPEYYDFVNSTQNLTGAEVFAKFASLDC